jgi:hypothetical protein
VRVGSPAPTQPSALTHWIGSAPFPPPVRHRVAVGCFGSSGAYCQSWHCSGPASQHALAQPRDV